MTKRGELGPKKPLLAPSCHARSMLIDAPTLLAVRVWSACECKCGRLRVGVVVSVGISYDLR
jgi:hypothetical protein